jgi:hypothetical protein
MTLPAGNRTDAIGANSTGDYDYTFRILTQNDLRVTVRNPDTDVESTLILTTDYTVSGVGDVGGGEITLVDANQAWLGTGNFLNTDWVITIRGVEALVQDTDIRNQGDYFPEGIEDAFDYQMRISQQQQDEIDRSAKLPETIDPADVDMTLPVPEAGSVIAWNADADGLENQVPNSSTYLTKATQSEAQDGVEDSHYMTPSKTKDAIDAQRVLASQAEAEAGTENTKFVSPLRVAQAIVALTPADSVTLTNTVTLTNKRITQRVVTTTDDATAVIDVAVTDVYQLSAVANATAFSFTGTPTDGQKFIIRYKDAGVSKALTWTGITAIGITLPTATTVSKWGIVGIIYNSAASQYQAVAVVTEA